MTDSFDASRYQDILVRAREAFLEDSFYAVKLAEDARALLDHKRTRDDPEAVRADALRLYRQGADRRELMRVLSVGDETFRAWDLENSSETHEKAPRRAVDPRDAFPEPRPVTVRFVTPKEQVPEFKMRGRNANASTFECPPEHQHEGRSTCYLRHGCRCQPCREWNSLRVRKNAQRNTRI